MDFGSRLLGRSTFASLTPNIGRATGYGPTGLVVAAIAGPSAAHLGYYGSAPRQPPVVARPS